MPIMRKVPHHLNRRCHGNRRDLAAARRRPAQQGTPHGARALDLHGCRASTAWFGARPDALAAGRGLCIVAPQFARPAGSHRHWRGRASPDPPRSDRILLILLIVELLYTVQVSFREHALVPEPFLLVGLISAIRRVLVLTAEFGEFRTEIGAQQFVIELAVLTVLIVALVASLILLRKSGASIAAHRA